MSRVKSIRHVGKEDVYDMAVDKGHNFSVANGKIVHNCDSLRYFAVWWTAKASAKDDRTRKRWTQDIWDDYDRASDEERELIIAKYGEPLI
jgi:hypothetical protein